MKKYFLKIFVSGILFIALLFSAMIITTKIVKNRNFKNYETRSNTLVFGENQHYDLMISGTSHARVFARDKNHLRVEKILHKSVVNIAQGGAICGINEQFFYLKYFYHLNNSVDKLLIFLSTPWLYTDILPQASNTFNEECFDFRFLFDYLRFDSENKSLRILDYCRSKLSLHWITLKPRCKEAFRDSLTSIDSTGLQVSITKFYDPNNIKRFKKSCKIFEKEIIFAQKHNIEVIFILPPALFGRWPGEERVLEFAKRMKTKYGVKYYDFSESVMEPKYYYDHQHLNTYGVVYFTKNFLKPILSADKSIASKISKDTPQ